MLFRIWTLLRDICRLGDSVWRAVACFSSPLVTQLVRDCMSRRHHISCEQEEFLAASCVGLEWQKDWSSISACFKGLVKTSPPSACGRLRAPFPSHFLAKSGNQATKPTALCHHQHTTEVLVGSPFETLSNLCNYQKSNPGSARLCPYRGSSWHSFWKPHYSARAIPEEHLGRQPFKGEFLHKVRFYSRTEWREWPFWCCWAALQQKIPHSVNYLSFIILLVCNMVFRKIHECTES